MEKVQAKLKECIEKQTSSMEGLERLSKQFGHTDVPEPKNFDDNQSNKMMVDGERAVADALETTTATTKAAADLKGENKTPLRKTRRGRKYSYMLRGKGESKKEKKEKPKPKYFCQF